MQTFYVSTAFPYAYDIPHCGNILQFIKADTYNKLINAFYNSKVIRNKSVLYMSFHATGITIKRRLDQFRSELDRFHQSTPSESELKAFIKELFERNNILELYKYFKHVDQITTLDGWIDLMSMYYQDVWDEIGIRTTLPVYHTTTQVDVSYSKFVNAMYEQLDKRSLLELKDHYLIGCDKCKNILGDHDRSTYEGIGLEAFDVLVTTVGEYEMYDVDDSNTYYVDRVNHTAFGSKLVQHIMNLKIKNTSLVFCSETEPCKYFNLSDASIVSKTELLNDDRTTDRRKIYTTIRDIRCKCSGSAQVVRVATWFVKFSDSEWKETVRRKILSSVNTKSIKDELIDASIKLRDVAFLRRTGYGTTLDVLRDTSFKDHVVDSLMDSAVHPYYTLMMNERFDLNRYDHVPPSTFKVHTTGKDLIPTHLVYFCYFSSLLFPRLDLPFFDTTKFLTARNNQKMSKSLGNVIRWTDVRDRLTGLDLRRFISYIADTNEPIVMDYDNIKKQSSQVQSACRRLRSACDRRWTNMQLQNVTSVIKNVVQCLNLEADLVDAYSALKVKLEPQRRFGLRRLQHYVLYQTYSAYKSTQLLEPVHTYNVNEAEMKNLLLELVKVYS